MKTYTSETIRQDRLDVIKCDVCKRAEDADSIEAHSFVSISDQCGYGSVFGDGHQIDLDMCQYCAKEILSAHIRVSVPPF